MNRTDEASMQTYTLADETKFIRLYLIGLGLAAIGWQVWMEVFYRSTWFEKAAWCLVPLVPVILAQKRAVVAVSTDRRMGLLLVAAGILGALLLDFPFGLPSGLLAVAALALIIAKTERAYAIASSVFLLAMLLGVQAIVSAFTMRWTSGMACPGWLCEGIGIALRAVGVEAGVCDTQVIVRNAHFAWRCSPSPGILGLSWIFPLAASGVILLWALRGVVVSLCWLLVMVVVFPICRYALLVIAFLQWETMDWWFSAVISLMSFLPCVFFIRASRGVSVRSTKLLALSWRIRKDERTVQIVTAVIIAIASIGMLLLGVILPDPGKFSQGRVLVDEAHGGWEWTTESFGTDWYGGAATYNYWCLFDYVSDYYPTRRNYQRITPAILAETDVLVVKTPTRSFTLPEIDAIAEWVNQGGGLYVIGDHTNVFGMTTCLEPLTSRFGIRFGYDSTHELETGKLQTQNISPLLRHPVLAGMPDRFLWGTSCSIVTDSLAEPILVGNYMRTRYLDYGQKGFFATTYLFPSERYGAILQCVGRKCGNGRVVAFSDSTIFSNFWVFFPGKSELVLGSLNWLNRVNTIGLTRWLPIVAGVLGLVVVVLFIHGTHGFSRILILAAMVAFPLSIGARDTIAAAWYHLPDAALPRKALVFDREYSNMSVPDFNMQGAMEDSYQTLFTWVQRLGAVPRCVYEFDNAIQEGSKYLIMVRPSRMLSEQDATMLDEYLRQGGRLLVIDGPGKHLSATNLVTERYGVRIEFRPAASGAIHSVADTSAPFNVIPSQVLSVEGGDAILMAGESPVLSRVCVGKGELWICSLGSLWSDAVLGTSNADVNELQRQLSELLYWTLEHYMDD